MRNPSFRTGLTAENTSSRYQGNSFPFVSYRNRYPFLLNFLQLCHLKGVIDSSQHWCLLQQARANLYRVLFLQVRSGILKNKADEMLAQCQNPDLPISKNHTSLLTQWSQPDIYELRRRHCQFKDSLDCCLLTVLLPSSSKSHDFNVPFPMNLKAQP